MKITKKQEEEILKVYYAYWDAYLQGNTRAMSLLMDENCQVIGSGQGEVFSNRKTAIKYYKSTADQVAGKAEMRNRKINMSPAGSQILIREESDFFVMMDSVWTFYWQARISTLFAKSDRKWKIIHQHGSLPDARTSGGEQVNTDKIRAENVRLKDAVKRRTIELEQKNRELEIEAALERVRARTMAMQSSNELKEVVANLFDGLKSLGVDPSVCNIALVDKKTNDTDVWTAHQTDHGILTYKIFIQHFDHPFRTKLLDSFLKKIPFSIHELSGDLKKSYVKYLLEHVDYSNAPDEVTKSNEKLADMEGGIVLSAAYMNYGFLIISRSSAISIDESDILQRFARIFEQTYTRFLDLKQAETQAREGQIEAALERVRSRTMGMQKSEELKEVIQVVYEQFVHLNILIEHTGFIMDYKARDDMHIWLADQHEVPSEVTIPYFDCAHWNSFNEAKKKGIDFFANHLTFEEKNRFYQDLFKLIPGVPGETLEYYFSCPGLAISTVLLENVGLYIENFSGIPYSDEENNTLMRFGKVFQQTYTRFLDLQKAEAQTREAKIEMALEKIRSRTMAMQHSDELPEAANLLFLEVQALGIPAWSSGFNVLAEDKKTCDSWMSSEGAIQEPFTLFFTEEASFIEMYNFLQSDESFFVQELEGKAIEDHYNYMRKIPKLGVVIKKLEDAGISLPTYQINHLCKFTHGFLLFITYEPVPDAHDLFKRFTKVFEQTYTRFLDLQKAEAQAEEAKIETALERVRARAMGMHKSDELADLSFELVKQIQALGVSTWFCAFNIYDDDQKGSLEWGSNAEGTYPNYRTPREGIFLRYYEAGQSGETLLINEIGENECAAHYEYLCSLPGVGEQLLKMKDSGISFPDSQIDHVAYFKYGYIIFITFVPAPEAHDIFKRFAKVFEQTYTRFLDLQKAEAQNKIIQAENERKTQELEEARQLQLSMLPKQLPKLPNLDIAVYMQTATEVGGDYYDFQVGIDGTLTTIIGDATGHGMKAGTVVTITKSLFNSMATNENILGTFDKISQVIKGMKFRQLAMCLLMMKIRGNRLSMSAAAMPPALIYRAKNKSVEELFLKGMPLGTMKKFPYKKIESHLYSGDRILLYSDGLPELANENNEMYGYDRIKTEFHSVGDKEPEEIVDHFKNSASLWANSKVPDDDVTFVVIKVK